jgi:hypothetical protein
MSTIDIRQVEDTSEVNKIIFSNGGDRYVTGSYLLHRQYRLDTITILDEEEDSEIIIESVEQVENLIKALNKAVELGWVK